LLLVAAFSGKSQMNLIDETEMIARLQLFMVLFRKSRFYSLGDAMLIL